VKKNTATDRVVLCLRKKNRYFKLLEEEGREIGEEKKKGLELFTVFSQTRTQQHNPLTTSFSN